MSVSVKVSELPSAQVIAKAIAEVKVTDARGRVFTLRQPALLAQYRIVLAAGPEVARNETYMNMVNPLTYITEIDGDPEPLPGTHREIEALIDRLDTDGLEAVVKGIVAHWGKKDAEADKEALKK